jgi:hypothetical protein
MITAELFAPNRDLNFSASRPAEMFEPYDVRIRIDCDEGPSRHIGGIVLELHNEQLDALTQFLLEVKARRAEHQFPRGSVYQRSLPSLDDYSGEYEMWKVSE